MFVSSPSALASTFLCLYIYTCTHVANAQELYIHANMWPPKQNKKRVWCVCGRNEDIQSDILRSFLKLPLPLPIVQRWVPPKQKKQKQPRWMGGDEDGDG
jgi:hypothetical protein